MDDDIPKWCFDRARQLRDQEKPPSSYSNFERSFARFIAAHETEPVDPFLAEARALIAATYGETRMDDGSFGPAGWSRRVEIIRDGRGDDYWEMRCVLAALRRGIEIANEGKAE